MPEQSSKADRRYGGFIGVLAAVLVVSALTALLHARFAMSERPKHGQPLTVAAADYRITDSFEREISYLGLVSTGRQATLGFEVAGTIKALPWREGSALRSGAVVAHLDDATLQANARATRAELEQAKYELELARLKARRQSDLRETGAVSREAYDETRLQAKALSARVESIEARLQSIEISIDRAALKAPYDGVIADRFLHEGSVVNPGTPVVHFIESAGKEAHIGVSVFHSADLVPGQMYTLALRGERLASELLAIRPDVDPVTRVTTAVFALPDGLAALDGEPVSLKLSETITATGGWVPLSALLEGSRGLWTVLRLQQQDGVTTSLREAVEVIEIKEDQAFVHGSLPSGSRIVATGVHRITPGTAIVVAGSK